MKRITDKDNHDPVSSTWPFGKIRDKTNSVAGTPVNADVYQDHHQFFAKLMDAAGITPNGNLDNATNGFQLHDAYYAGIETMIKAYLLSIVGADSIESSTYYFFGNNLYYTFNTSGVPTFISGLAYAGSPSDPMGDGIYTFVYQNGNVYLYDGNPTTGVNPQFGFKKGFKTIKWLNSNTNTSFSSAKLYTFTSAPNREIRNSIKDVDKDFNLGFATPDIMNWYATFNDKILTVYCDIRYNITFGDKVVLNIGRRLKQHNLRIKGQYNRDLSDVDENTQFHLIYALESSNPAGAFDLDVLYGMRDTSNNSLLVIYSDSGSGVNYRSNFTATFFLEKF